MNQFISILLTAFCLFAAGTASFARGIDPKADAAAVARALEILRVSGFTKTELDRRSLEGGDRYDATVLGLRYEDREVLYRRIERRVDEMLRMGLVEETRALLAEGVFEKNRTAAQAIGYKEILPYCQGACTLDEAAEALKTATRRYAKRQMTWFSARPYVQWIEAMENGRQKTFEEIVNNARGLFQK